MKRYEFLVLTRPVTGSDDEFNRWYDKQHVPDVLAVPGFVSARRFRVLESIGDASLRPQWQYVALYTIESDDGHATIQELMKREHTPELVVSATLDRPTATAFLIEQISNL